MHTHFGSITSAVAAFLHVILIGTLWRLVALHMVASPNPTVRGLGRAMGVQY
jgi:hypothetical protein